VVNKEQMLPYLYGEPANLLRYIGVMGRQTAWMYATRQYYAGPYVEGASRDMLLDY